MRKVYRIVFLLALFCLSGVIFAGKLPETGSFSTLETVNPGTAALPTITLITGGEEIGCLHGYCFEPENNLLRDAVLPVGPDASFQINIAEFDMNIRRLKYTLSDIAGGAELCSETVNAFEKENGAKAVRVRLRAELKENTEYALTITLINNIGKRIYYFARVKQEATPLLSGKLEFIRNFSANTRSGSPQDREAIIPYLEMEPGAPEGSFSYVNIHSNYRLVSWEGLAPRLDNEPVITVTESNGELISARLQYLVTIDTGFGEESYQVEERYRIRYLKDVVHLLSYERFTEALFDVERASISQSDLKLGICTDSSVKLYRNEDNSAVAFERNGSLYEFSLSDNTVSIVFSNEKRTIGRNFWQQGEHSIQILKTDKNGDISFLVKGYMNRGAYEGRVGLFLYQYHKSEGYLSELLYIPMNISEQQLLREVSSYVYLNDANIFFFLYNDTFYSCDPITRERKELAGNIRRMAYASSGDFLAYQSEGQEDSVSVFYPKSGVELSLPALENEYIRLLSSTEDLLICGYGRREEIKTDKAGNITEALYRLSLVSPFGVTKKEYQKEGFFVTEAETKENVIKLIRVKKSTDYGYEKAEDDFILSSEPEQNEKIQLEIRVTEKMLSEYYITFPTGFIMEETPKRRQTPYEIAKGDLTLSLKDLKAVTEKYYTYYFGKISGSYEKAGDAVSKASAEAGVVLNQDGRVVYEREIKGNVLITDLTGVKSSDRGNSVDAALSMMLQTKGIQSNRDFHQESDSLVTFLSSESGQQAVNLTGIPYEELFYYINKNQPVLAMVTDTKAILITGYRSNALIYYDPDAGRSVTTDRETAESLLQRNGFVMVGFLY